MSMVNILKVILRLKITGGAEAMKSACGGGVYGGLDTWK